MMYDIGMSNLYDVIDVPRKEWLPRTPDIIASLTIKPVSRLTKLEVHHTATTGGELDPFQDWKNAFRYHHDILGWKDIWYNLGVHPDGRIVELRGVNAANSSRPYLAVNLPGNDHFNEAQQAAMHRIGQAMIADQTAGHELAWHQQRSATVCPGAGTIVKLSAMKDGFPEDVVVEEPTMTHPIVAVLSGTDTSQYATVHADGGVATFGGYPFYGSIPGDGIVIEGDVVVAASAVDGGYRMVTLSGAVFNFGTAEYSGRVYIKRQ